MLGHFELGWLRLILLFLKLLTFDKSDVVCPCHSTVTCFFPRRIGDVLHFEESVWRRFVFNTGILELLIKVLSVVLFRVH